VFKLLADGEEAVAAPHGEAMSRTPGALTRRLDSDAALWKRPPTGEQEVAESPRSFGDRLGRRNNSPAVLGLRSTIG
jgi:hypothetical protein